MANITTAEANRLLDASWGTVAYTNPTAPVKIRLTTTAPTAAAAGTEVVGGSYVAQTVAMGAAAAGANSNTGALTYNGMPAVTVVGVDQFDSAGSPFRRWFGNLTASKTTNAGDTFSIAIAALTASLS